jgi:Ca-activated chloride channel family protein
MAAEHLEKGRHEKKVLLVVSDGEDNNSKSKLGQVVEEIRESRIIVYPVGILGGDEGLFNRWIFATKAKKALKKFSEVTGGRSFFPHTVNEVDEVCQRIAHELRNQYALGYKPSNEKLDGSWRKIHVQVQPPTGTSKVQVRTKQGYYAPSATGRDAALTRGRALWRR